MAGVSPPNCVGTTLGALLKTEKTAKYKYHYTKNRKRVKFLTFFLWCFCLEVLKIATAILVNR